MWAHANKIASDLKGGHEMQRVGQVNAAAHARRAAAMLDTLSLATSKLSAAPMGKLNVAELPVLPKF